MADRRALLVALTQVPLDGVDAASSGCAQDGAHRLALARAEAAAVAIARWDAGLGEVCAACGAAIGPERLATVLTATTCVRCA